ncbi:hypothetical protein NM208_g7117 [Fusarium decemcellulare]|uniref:Uncharacterized protein n=1 Tax=Fusarium decemcellulare TaxID=57161 RepID=A0ACC1SAC2_9HYPO|nr:hypothetical protein NM208_g7117 [Fusarium decemcellulare]
MPPTSFPPPLTQDAIEKLKNLKGTRFPVCVAKDAWVRHLSVGVDERAKAANAGVDTRKVRAGTSITPRDNTDESAGRGVNERTTAVTLARVLATRLKASADHVGGDLGSAVLGTAGSARDNRDSDLPQADGKAAATLGSGTPAFLPATMAEDPLAGQLPDGNVVVERAAAEARVNGDGRDTDKGTTRVAVL